MIQQAKNLNNKKQYSMSDKGGKSKNGYFYSDCSEFATKMYKYADITDKLFDKNSTTHVKAIPNGQIPGLKMVIWEPTGEDRTPYLKYLIFGDLLYLRLEDIVMMNLVVQKFMVMSHVELYAGDGYITGQDALGPNLAPNELISDKKVLQGSGPTYRSLEI